MQNITEGVRKLPKPQSVQVGLTPGFKQTVLNVVHQDGTAESLPISKKVAETLIAKGMSYEG
jgi:hypothetical protein